MEWIANSSDRLDLCLARLLGRSRAFSKFQISHRAVQVNGRVIEKPSYLLKPGDNVQVELMEEEPLRLEAVEKPLDILYEDSSVLVLNKPQGWVVHPASGHKGETLVHYLLHHLKDSEFKSTSALRPGIVHRLDRGTSGCLIVARDRQALENLSAQFKDRKIEKEYEAVVWNRMKESGSFTGAIGRHAVDRKRMTTRRQGGRDALTEWKRGLQTEHFTHVHLFPRTGRTHQLRVHLAEAGFPIVADKVYCKKARDLKDLAPPLQELLGRAEFPFLHARRVAFFHPVSGERIELSAPRPEIFQQLIDTIRGNDHATKNNFGALGL